MKSYEKLTAFTVVSALLCCGMAFAQDQRYDQRDNQRNDQQNYQRDNQRNDQQNYHRNDQQNPQRNDDHNDGHAYGQNNNHYDNKAYVQHGEWRSGHRMNQNDWARAERVDWRAHHLRAPRRGYEWRQVDGNYVLAAVATGLIASVIANSVAH